jgi:predicted RNase H-like HicB family nuclease
MKYVYPAIFKKDEGVIYVSFPDLESCFTQGKDMVEAIEMAEDALALTLVYLEDNRQDIPKASDIRDIQAHDAAVSLVITDTMKYRKENSSKAVKKTLTIPSWLNEAAEKQSINFSQVLQDALMEHIGVK